MAGIQVQPPIAENVNVNVEVAHVEEVELDARLTPVLKLLNDLLFEVHPSWIPVDSIEGLLVGLSNPRFSEHVSGVWAILNRTRCLAIAEASSRSDFHFVIEDLDPARSVATILRTPSRMAEILVHNHYTRRGLPPTNAAPRFSEGSPIGVRFSRGPSYPAPKGLDNLQDVYRVMKNYPGYTTGTCAISYIARFEKDCDEMGVPPILRMHALVGLAASRLSPQ